MVYSLYQIIYWSSIISCYSPTTILTYLEITPNFVIRFSHSTGNNGKIVATLWTLKSNIWSNSIPIIIFVEGFYKFYPPNFFTGDQ